MNPLQCPACGYTNEAGRVFCHNCGLRLPKSDEEAESQQAAEQEHGASTRRQGLTPPSQPIKKKPGGVVWKDLLAGVIVSGLKLALLAAIGAAIFLAVREPLDLPVAATREPALSARIDRQLAEAEQQGFHGEISLTEKQINSYLVTKVQIKPQVHALLGEILVERVFLDLGNKSFWLGAEYRFFGKPVVLQSEFALTGSSEQWSLEAEDARIGRLVVPISLVKKYIPWFDTVAQSFRNTLETLASADLLEIAPTGVSAQWLRAEREFSPSLLNPTPPLSRPSSSAAPSLR